MAKAAKKKGGKRKKSKEGDTTGMSAVEGAANLNLNFELEGVKVGGLKAEVQMFHWVFVFGRYYEGLVGLLVTFVNATTIQYVFKEQIYLLQLPLAQTT